MNLNDLNVEELREVAEMFPELEWEKGWTKKPLREALEDYFKENPNKVAEAFPPDPPSSDPPGGTTPNEPTPPVPPPTPPAPNKKGMYKIKSIHRGKITCSTGEIDFGEDGIAEVNPKTAKLLTSINGYEMC